MPSGGAGMRGNVGKHRSAMLAVLSVAALVLAALVTLPSPAVAATNGVLTRYPYLTDAVQSSVTVNWATDTTGTTGSLTWGPPGNCGANTVTASKTSITVIAKPEYQWKADIPVSPDAQYCYRVRLGSTDLLGGDASPAFTSQVAAGSTAPFSFAVFGDWGQAYAGGVNADQTNVLSQLAGSGARFAVMTGDTAYPGAGQKEYGDLQQLGVDQSTIFGPASWAVPGRSLPVFNVTGNHGFTNGSVQVTNWPEQHAASTSNGKYQMENYPAINGSTPKSYPSFWYAFDAGQSRFYVLTASWADANLGTGSVYQNDRDAHWTTSSAEYQWLKADLEAHPNALKFAFWHYPLYADSNSQPGDTYLRGGNGTLQGLLDQNNVAMAFNGHAHGYQRNAPDSAGLVSHVLGNGGAALGSVSGCSSTDLYAIGANGSHCGAAPAGLSNDHVYGFAKVTVNGRQVTVTPTDELGRTYDIKTYTFPTNEPDAVPPTPPTTVSATANSAAKVTVTWSGATDNVGVTGYQVYRDGELLTETTTASYPDTTVSPSTQYSYTVKVLDAAGNISTSSAAATVTTPGADDTTPPTQPGNLSATAPSSSQVNLSWTASTDNVMVTGYRVYRNGILLPGPTTDDPTPPTTYTDDTALPGSSYTYQVSAVDAAGNESSKASVSVTTPSGVGGGGGGGGTLTFAAAEDVTVDSSKPTVNFNSNARLTVDNSPQVYSLVKFDVAGTNGCSVAGAKLRLTVGSGTDDKSIYGGDVYGTSNGWSEATTTWSTAPAAGVKAGSVSSAVVGNTSYLFDVTPLVSGDGTVSFLVRSVSGDGARYYTSESGTATTAPQLQVTCGGGGGGGGGDTSAPSQPGNLAAVATAGSQVDLSWSGSTDNVGVTGYRVYRNGSGTPMAALGGSARSFTDDTVQPGTGYTYQVSAVDAAGNESSKASVSVTTPGGGGGGGTLTFAAAEDVTVDSSKPTVNFNSNARLTVDNSPQVYSLVKFDVAGTNGCSVAGAKLRLTVGSGTDDKSIYGGDVYGTSNGWSEATTTWSTAPAAGVKAGSVSSAVVGNTSYLFDVTSLVSGDGTVSFLVRSVSGDGARYYTSESGTATTAPQLQVTCG